MNSGVDSQNFCVDSSSDMFTIGLTLFAMFAGEALWTGELIHICGSATPQVLHRVG